MVGNDEELLHAIPILLGCTKKDIVEGNYIEMAVVRDIGDLMKETAFSRLMEVSDILIDKIKAFVHLTYINCKYVFYDGLCLGSLSLYFHPCINWSFEIKAILCNTIS